MLLLLCERYFCRNYTWKEMWNATFAKRLVSVTSSCWLLVTTYSVPSLSHSVLHLFECYNCSNMWISKNNESAINSYMTFHLNSSQLAACYCSPVYLFWLKK
jgi:hypothetical protein